MTNKNFMWTTSSITGYLETGLIEQLNQKDCSGDTAIIKASKMGHYNLAKRLINQKGINLNSISKNIAQETNVLSASCVNYPEIALLLLDQKNIDTNLALESIAKNKVDISLSKKILKKEQTDLNFILNKKFNLSFFMASCTENKEISEFLLKNYINRIDIELQDCFGSTAFEYACKHQPSLVSLFLERTEIDLFKKDKNNEILIDRIKSQNQKSYNIIESFLSQKNMNELLDLKNKKRNIAL